MPIFGYILVVMLLGFLSLLLFYDIFGHKTLWYALGCVAIVIAHISIAASIPQEKTITTYDVIQLEDMDVFIRGDEVVNANRLLSKDLEAGAQIIHTQYHPVLGLCVQWENYEIINNPTYPKEHEEFPVETDKED